MLATGAASGQNNPTTSAGANTSSTNPATSTTGGTVPTISLTAQNPTYPKQPTDQNAPKIVVAWDPSFANLQSLTFGLTVTDNLNSVSLQKTVTVIIQPPPVAVIAAITNPVTAGSGIALDGTQSTGANLSYKWQLMNTTPSSTNTTP
jgi:hypothetical protein